MKTIEIRLKSGELIKECEVFKDMKGVFLETAIASALDRANNKTEIFDHRTEKFRVINTDDIDMWKFN